MSSFNQYALHLSRFPTHDTSEYLNASEISALTCVSGFFGVKAYYQVQAIKEALEKMNELVGQISNGPQPEISLQYGIIDRIQKLILQSVQKLDQDMPDNYKCTPGITQVLQQIAQFAQYIPSLVSASAPSYSQYIPNFQEIFRSACSVIDSIAAVFKAVPTIIQSLVTPIDETNALNKQVGALVHLTEILQIDLIKFMNNERIFRDQATVQDINKWIETLYNFSNTLFSVIGKPGQTIVNAMASVSSSYPSIIDVFSTVKATIPNSPFFADAMSHVIAFVQFVSQIEFSLSYASAKSAASLISQSFASNNATTLLETMNPVFESLYKRVKACLYGTLQQDALAIITTVGTIDTTNVPLVCQSCAVALVIFGVTCGMRPDCYELITSIINQCFAITTPVCQSLKQTAANAATIISENESVYDAKKLAHMNYYLKLILDSAVPESQTFGPLRPFIVSSVSLPAKIDLLAAGTGTEEQFAECNTQMREASNTLSDWSLMAALAYANLITNKADMIASIASFGASLAQMQQPTGGIVAALQGAPRYSRLDASSAIRIEASINDIRQAVDSIIKQPQAQIISNAMITLFSEQPLQIKLAEMFTTADQPGFISLLAQIADKLILSIQNCEKIIGTKPRLFANYFSLSFSYTLLISAAVEAQLQLAGQIAAYPTTMKGYLDVIWPAAVQLASDQSQDASALQMYNQALLKSVQEMQQIINSMPQPSLTYEISEELKAVRSLQAENQKLPINLKHFGQKIIAAAISNPKAIPYLSTWFNAAAQPVAQIDAVADAAASDAFQAISRTMPQTFFWNIELLMVALVSTEVTEIAKCSETLFAQFLDDIIISVSQPEVLLQRVRQVYERAHQVKWMMKFAKTKAVDAPAFVSAAIASSAFRLTDLSRHYDTNALAYTMMAVSSYNALAMLFPDAAANAANFQQYATLLTTISSGEEASKAASEVCSIYQQHVKDAFELTSISGSKVIDSLYDFFEEIRFNANAILKAMQTSDTMPELVPSATRQFISNTASVIFLVSKAIPENPEEIIDGTTEIASSLPLIINGAINERSEKSVLGFRRGNRNIAKQVDTFINLSETPQESKKKSEFDLLKHKMLKQLVSVIVECMRKISVSVLALQPDSLLDTSSQFTAANNSFASAFEAVKEKAVGKTKKPFVDLFAQLSNTLQTFSTITCNFTLPFPPTPIVEASSRLASAIQRFVQATAAATDILIIDPDPVAAKNVPDYKPNFTAKTTLAPTDAFSDLEAAHADLQTALNAFNDVIKNDSATSDEILEQAEAIKNAGDAVVNAAVVMAASTQDKKSQVDQQTNVHTLAQAITSVLSAIKSRLMRTSSFEADMKDALVQLNETAQKAVTLGDAASKIVAQEDDDDAGGDDEGDDVSNELKATASAISDMSSRLAQFSAQLAVNIEVEEIDDIGDLPQEEEDGNEAQVEAGTIDIKAEEGTMAAYIIACATPIMQTAAEILQRSQAICREMRGKITNEAFIIKCAHDVTESAQLLIIAAEIAIENKEKDPEYIAIAASNMVKSAIANLVAQILQQGGDPEGIMMKKVKAVRFYCIKINKKVEAIARQKWAEANPMKKTGNKMVLRMNANTKLNKYREDLDNAERARKAFRRK